MENLEDKMEKVELEEQFILRLPQVIKSVLFISLVVYVLNKNDSSTQKEANKVKHAMRNKPKKLKNMLTIALDKNLREGKVTVNKKKLNAKVMDLPTIVESYKTVDKVNLYKTANVSQIMVCSRDKNETNETGRNSETKEKKKHNFQHGLTPPLKNVRKYRFRKTMKNPNDVLEAEDIEKEILWLLRSDNEAVR